MSLTPAQKAIIDRASSLRGVDENAFCREAERDGEDPVKWAERIVSAERDLKEMERVDAVRPAPGHKQQTALPKKPKPAASSVSADDLKKEFEAYQAFRNKFDELEDQGDADGMLALLDESQETILLGELAKIAKQYDNKHVPAIQALMEARSSIEVSVKLSRIHRARREALEKRVGELESLCATLRNKGIEYCGVWDASNDYDKGDLVTHRGSMWHANGRTRQPPGETRDWTLAVKKGRDAR